MKTILDPANSQDARTVEDWCRIVAAGAILGIALIVTGLAALALS